MLGKGSSKEFTERQYFTAAERNAFLGTNEEYKQVKDLLAMPLDVVDRFGNPRKGVFTCKQPLQIRIMGSVPEVRKYSQKLVNYPPTEVGGLSRDKPD